MSDPVNQDELLERLAYLEKRVQKWKELASQRGKTMRQIRQDVAFLCQEFLTCLEMHKQTGLKSWRFARFKAANAWFEYCSEVLPTSEEELSAALKLKKSSRK